MPQSSAIWDEDVLGCPELRTYSVNQDTLQRRAEPLDGPARFRRVLEDGVVTVGLSVPMTADQFLAFEAFVADTLEGGKLWFTIELYVGTVKRPLLMRLADDYSYQIIGARREHARVEMALEGFERESTAYENAVPIFLYAGTPAAPSDQAELRGGTPAAPSQTDVVVWGGLGAGFKNPVGL